MGKNIGWKTISKTAKLPECKTASHGNSINLINPQYKFTDKANEKCSGDDHSLSQLEHSKKGKYGM